MDIQNTASTCTVCSTPIRNLATDGRPDVWGHTRKPQITCYYPIPPYEVAEALPRETRKIRIRVEERVTYEVEREIKVHVGVTQDELADYLALNDDEWGEDIEEHFFSARDREVISDCTFFTDDAGYLANLATGIEVCPKSITKWLTIVCPVCGVQPAEDDTAHQNVGYFVGIACNGQRLVDPGWLQMDGTSWTDWTEPQPADASGKAGV
ncbi:hypothetical protein E1286_38715 [Nonomuraea terrae]|uniref:Uncharacterized protein n=1 Tax=Nonomuraea terrae TaxID=2530383 RepID=A0A4R4XZV3_9ACTN|nr:hypothetical protein [Nonomuraea terrae]TDD36102.1 hypothetical protein E1286_38715 [Nonomuraea terrae]